MKFGDINIGHIYNVIFDPVEQCEFNGKHLALVLKRNNDNRTFIVMPLTSEASGVGKNKINLGKISSLPSSLKKNDTYAVFNQIRTLNAVRFIALKEGTSVIQSKLDDTVFMKLLNLGIKDILHNVAQEDKLNLLKGMYEEQCVIKAKDLAYAMIKLEKENKELTEEILKEETEAEKAEREEIERIEAEKRNKKAESMKKEIKSILYNISYDLYPGYIDPQVKAIFDSITKI